MPNSEHGELPSPVDAPKSLSVNRLEKEMMGRIAWDDSAASVEKCITVNHG